jgi:hypothetical protein
MAFLILLDVKRNIQHAETFFLIVHNTPHAMIGSIGAGGFHINDNMQGRTRDNCIPDTIPIGVTGTNSISTGKGDVIPISTIT